MQANEDHGTPQPSPLGIPAPPPVINPPEAPRALTSRQHYNVVSDTVVGVNFRAKDNLTQFIAILLSLILGIGIGTLASADDRVAGAIVGGLVGLVAGLLLSGLVLMVYRGTRHASGKHD